MNDGESNLEESRVLAELHAIRKQLTDRFDASASRTGAQAGTQGRSSPFRSQLSLPASRLFVFGSFALGISLIMMAFVVLAFMVDRLHSRIAFVESHIIDMRRDLDEIYRFQTLLRESLAIAPDDSSKQAVVPLADGQSQDQVIQPKNP